MKVEDQHVVSLFKILFKKIQRHSEIIDAYLTCNIIRWQSFTNISVVFVGHGGGPTDLRESRLKIQESVVVSSPSTSLVSKDVTLGDSSTTHTNSDYPHTFSWWCSFYGSLLLHTLNHPDPCPPYPYHFYLLLRISHKKLRILF